MITFSVRAWSAWAPGVESSEDWMQWARAPAVLPLEGSPELKFIPAMQRRRFSRLSRMALQVAFDVTPPELQADACSVFASRHGESNACVALLTDIARAMPLSPTAFSHSVHNTQGGQFSIAAGNGRPSSSIAAGTSTFCAGLIEAAAMCERHRPRPTLLVVADEPPPEILRDGDDELPAAFALALLLDVDVHPPAPAFRMELVAAPERSAKPAPRLPQALEFLAWMIAGEGKLALPFEDGSWTFQRLVH
ncbi:MAG TPA: beta-ketoacyl synthase chain length factor [Planctomycetota bacterium]|nr:beta-ketoacyl synthase chain length factor [Planctomycetota bacterium]